MFRLVTPRRAYQVRAACVHRIGMCGYTSVPEDGRTCSHTKDHSEIPMLRPQSGRVPKSRWMGKICEFFQQTTHYNRKK